MYLKSSTSPARSLRNPIETETDSIDIGHTSTKDFPSEPGVPAWSSCLPTTADVVVSLTQNTPSPYPLDRIPPAAATKPIITAHGIQTSIIGNWLMERATIGYMIFVYQCLVFLLEEIAAADASKLRPVYDLCHFKFIQWMMHTNKHTYEFINWCSVQLIGWFSA